MPGMRSAAGLETLAWTNPCVYPGSRVLDVVTLLASLPSMPKPLDSLFAVHEHLAPVGRLIASVYNTGSAAARILGEDWQGWDLPRQYNHFTAESLRMKMERAG